jgi:hypothetical protein
VVVAVGAEGEERLTDKSPSMVIVGRAAHTLIHSESIIACGSVGYLASENVLIYTVISRT